MAHEPIFEPSLGSTHLYQIVVHFGKLTYFCIYFWFSRTYLLQIQTYLIKVDQVYILSQRTELAYNKKVLENQK